MNKGQELLNLLHNYGHEANLDGEDVVFIKANDLDELVDDILELLKVEP